MSILRIESTFQSPEVIMDAGNGIYSIIGKSVISDVEEFYSPVLNWLEETGKGITSKMEFKFDLEYFNIASSKRLLFVLYKLGQLKEEGVDVSVVWMFNTEDDDMKEVGEDFACMVNIPFEFVSKDIYPEFA